MSLPLPRFLETHETRREHARRLEQTVREAGSDLRERTIHVDPCDARTLRGIPAIGRGVAGVINGTAPGAQT